jgi:hypothetical protein
MEERMLGMMAEIELPLGLTKPETVSRRKRRKRDMGNEVDIHEVRQGRLDRAWTRTEKIALPTVGNKLVHIDINLSAAAGVSLEDMLWRGAVVLRIYDALTKMGKSVSISGYYASYHLWGMDRIGMVSCKIKDYGEPMSTAKLAAMVHGAFFRTFLMGNGAMQHPEYTADSGRGWPVDDSRLRCSDAEEDEARGGHVVHIGQCFSKHQADEVLSAFIDQYVQGETGHVASTEALKQWRKG